MVGGQLFTEGRCSGTAMLQETLQRCHIFCEICKNSSSNSLHLFFFTKSYLLQDFVDFFVVVVLHVSKSKMTIIKRFKSLEKSNGKPPAGCHHQVVPLFAVLLRILELSTHFEETCLKTILCYYLQIINSTRN